MTIQKVTAVYFSPTRGTALYAETVAAALAPVYAGRLPAVKGLWDGLEGHDTPAVFLVSYGNRASRDTIRPRSSL